MPVKHFKYFYRATIIMAVAFPQRFTLENAIVWLPYGKTTCACAGMPLSFSKCCCDVSTVSGVSLSPPSSKALPPKRPINSCAGYL